MLFRSAAELVPEGARQALEQARVAASVRLQIGAVGERDLDLNEHVAGAELRARHLLEPQIARPVERTARTGIS